MEQPIQTENKIWHPAVDRLLLLLSFGLATATTWKPNLIDDIASSLNYYYLMRKCE